MSSIILRTATRFLITLLLLLSLFFLARGHNEPGGGFIGGLVGAASFALYTIAFGVSRTRRALRVDPRTLIGIGLLIAIASGLPAALLGLPFLTGQWGEVPIAGVTLPLGSPVFFDVGVYLVVVGITLTIILALEEEN